MGMDLDGQGGYFRFSNVGWAKVLDLGRAYGWIPAGTKSPPDREPLSDFAADDWPRCYKSNEGQEVTARDAAALADALERALDDIPDHVASEHRVRECKDALAEALSGVLGGAVSSFGPDPESSPLTWFSGPDHKQKLRDFIAYCRAGEFRIW